MADHEELEPTRPATGRRPPLDSVLPEPLRELIGRQLAGCTIDRVLGQGGMGAVFRGIEHGLGGRLVAVKVLLPTYAEQTEYLDRFQREAAAAAGLDSDHVVKIYRHGRQGRFPFLVMELVEGGTLLEQNGGECPPPAEVVRQLAQACEGLLAAERKGLVHRDIKPANIMLARRQVGRPGAPEARVDVKIVDFGVARPAKNLTATQPGTFIGSPLYASPEQWQLAAVTHASDMYSLGAAFYQLLVGRPAPPGRREREVREFTLAATCLSPRDANPQVPVELDAVIRKLTARQPRDRYESFADVIVALEAIGTDWRSRPQVEVQPQPRWRLVTAVAVLAVLALVLGPSYFGRPPVPSPERDAVLQLVAQARPGGALALRQADLREALREVPGGFVDGPTVQTVRERAAAVDARIAALRALEQRGIEQQPIAAEDWSGLRTSLRAPLGADAVAEAETEAEAERQVVAQLRREVGEFVALQVDLAAIDRDLTAVQQRLAQADADLPALLSYVQRLGERCADRASHADRAASLRELAATLAAESACAVQIRACAAAVDVARRLFPAAGAAVLRRQLEELPVLPAGLGVPTRAAVAALRAEYDTIKLALQSAVATDAAVRAALAQSVDLPAFVANVAAAWPLASDGLVAEWWKVQARRCADDFVAVVLDRLDVAGGAAPGDAKAAAWLAATEAALAAPAATRVVAASARADQLGRELTRARAALRASAGSPPAPSLRLPDGLPAEWPRERGTQDFYDGLTVERVGDRHLYRYRADTGDGVGMVLVQVSGVEPFLVDVVPVTYERFVRSRLFAGPCSGKYLEYLQQVQADDAHRQGSLVVAVTPECAEKYAAWAGKELLTLEQWRALETWLGPRSAGRMAELHERVHAGVPRLPRPFGWPTATGDSPLLSIGVRDLVRVGGARFEAVGHSLFLPKDRVMLPLEGDAARAHYRNEPLLEPMTAAYSATHIGFRCALPLRASR